MGDMSSSAMVRATLLATSQPLRQAWSLSTRASTRWCIPAAHPLLLSRAKKPSLVFSVRSLCSTAETIPVPLMGDSITEGTVVAFLKQVGEYVAVDEVVAQIETDKVTIDVMAPMDGTITAFCAEEDDTVEVGAELFKMTAGAHKPVAAAPVAPEVITVTPAAPPAAPPAVPAAAPAAAPAAPKVSTTPAAPESDAQNRVERCAHDTNAARN